MCSSLPGKHQRRKQQQLLWLSSPECGDNVSWLAQWPRTGWWLQQNSPMHDYKPRPQEIGHWHCSTAGDWTPLKLQDRGRMYFHFAGIKTLETKTTCCKYLQFAFYCWITSSGTARIFRSSPLNFFGPSKKTPWTSMLPLAASVQSDRNSWPSCMGHFGVGTLNENRQRLLELYFC